MHTDLDLQAMLGAMGDALVVCDAQGQVTACGSVIRDETDRSAEHRALRKRIAELEAQVKAGAPHT